MALLSRRRFRLWGFLSFSSQVVVLVGALTLAIGQPANAQSTTPQFTDIDLKSGLQLKERFFSLSKNRDVDTAVRYLADQKLTPAPEGFVEFEFGVVGRPGRYDLFFAPYAAAPASTQQHLLLVAEGPKGARVFLADFAVDPKEPLQVRDEKQVTDGKIVSGENHMKNFLKCSIAGCAPAAAGCVYGVSAWMPCFCLWCGGSVAGCGLLEIFYP
jgi:hypothetical protein